MSRLPPDAVSIYNEVDDETLVFASQSEADDFALGRLVEPVEVLHGAPRSV